MDLRAQVPEECQGLNVSEHTGPGSQQALGPQGVAWETV